MTRILASLIVIAGLALGACQPKANTDAAGTAPRQLGAAMPRAYYAGLKFSVDGKRLLVIRSETEVVELPLDGGVPLVLWRASTEALGTVDMTADGELWASITRWDGDLWLAEGRFP